MKTIEHIRVKKIDWNKAIGYSLAGAFLSASAWPIFELLATYGLFIIFGRENIEILAFGAGILCTFFVTFLVIMLVLLDSDFKLRHNFMKTVIKHKEADKT